MTITWVSLITHTATEIRGGSAFVASYTVGSAPPIFAVGCEFDATPVPEGQTPKMLSRREIGYFGDELAAREACERYCRGEPEPAPSVLPAPSEPKP